MSIEAYDYGKADGTAEERARIRDWVLVNRRGFELAEDVVIYRDSFDSESLLEFIDSGEKVKKTDDATD